MLPPELDLNPWGGDVSDTRLGFKPELVLAWKLCGRGPGLYVPPGEGGACVGIDDCEALKLFGE